jgi:iron complex outermembrane receptor protein
MLAQPAATSPADALPAVVVEAERFSSPTTPTPEEARKQLQLTPGGVDLIDEEQYREGRVSNLADTLGWSAGIFVAPRFGAEEARLSIRGSGLQRTFHMRGIEILQDGAPLTLADGSTDFQAIEPLATRYVQIWRGANALQYGASTLGGAIDFVSRTGLDVGPWAVRGEAGSFGYLRAQAQLAGASGDERQDAYLSLSQFQQDGFREHARQNTQRIFGNLGLRPSADLESRLYLALVDSRSRLPGALTRRELETDPRLADPAAVSSDQQRNFRLARLSNRTVFSLGAQRRLEFSAFVSQKTLFHPIFQVLHQDSDDGGAGVRYVSEGSLARHRNQLVVGALANVGRLKDDRFTNVGGHDGLRTGDSVQRSSNLSLYAENQFYLRERTALVLGGQWTDSRRRLEDRFLVDGDQSVDQRYRRFSPKIGVRQDLTADIQVYGNVSGSFEPPSFGELAGGPGVTPVDAQRATTLELGTRGLGRYGPGTMLRWDLSVYRAAVRQEMLSLTDAAGQPLGTVNAARTLHQGIEAAAELKFRDRLMGRASYQLNDFRFVGDPVYGDHRLAGLPRQRLALEILYLGERDLYAGPSLVAASSTWIDHANTLQAPGYAVLGFKLGQRATRGLSWFVDLRNLTDRRYTATTGVLANATGQDSRQFYPGDGRSAFVGVEWKP